MIHWPDAGKLQIVKTLVQDNPDALFRRLQLTTFNLLFDVLFDGGKRMYDGHRTGGNEGEQTS